MGQASIVASSFRRELSLFGANLDFPQVLASLFDSPTVGVAICDRRLRFRAINDALAAMNGIPAEAHLGKTVQKVLGSAAAKLQPAFQHVLNTGEPLCNFEVTAELPAGVHPVPGELDRQVAALKLAALGVEIDALTDEQRAYLSSWTP